MRSRSTSRFCLMLLMLSISWRTASAVLHTDTEQNLTKLKETYRRLTWGNNCWLKAVYELAWMTVYRSLWDIFSDILRSHFSNLLGRPFGSTLLTYVLSSTSIRCHFYLCWSVLHMLHLLHVCPSWERYPSSVAPPEASSCFSSIRCIVAKKGVSGVTDLLTSWSNSRLWLRCSNWLFFTRQLLFSSTWPFMWEWSPPPLSSFRWLICAAASTRIKLGNIPLIQKYLYSMWGFYKETKREELHYHAHFALYVRTT